MLKGKLARQSNFPDLNGARRCTDNNGLSCGIAINAQDLADRLGLCYVMFRVGNGKDLITSEPQVKAIVISHTVLFLGGLSWSWPSNTMSFPDLVPATRISLASSTTIHMSAESEQPGTRKMGSSRQESDAISHIL